MKNVELMKCFIIFRANVWLRSFVELDSNWVGKSQNLIWEFTKQKCVDVVCKQPLNEISTNILQTFAIQMLLKCGQSSASRHQSTELFSHLQSFQKLSSNISHFLCFPLNDLAFSNQSDFHKINIFLPTKANTQIS